jgi:hypothetical protein
MSYSISTLLPAIFKTSSVKTTRRVGAQPSTRSGIFGQSVAQLVRTRERTSDNSVLWTEW